MSVELIALKLKARLKLRLWFIHNINNKYGIDHLLDNELRFIMDNQTRSLTRRWFMERFPNMLGYF